LPGIRDSRQFVNELVLCRPISKKERRPRYSIYRKIRAV
jgi:hypothetical protein